MKPVEKWARVVTFMTCGGRCVRELVQVQNLIVADFAAHYGSHTSWLEDFELI